MWVADCRTVESLFGHWTRTSNYAQSSIQIIFERRLAQARNERCRVSYSRGDEKTQVIVDIVKGAADTQSVDWLDTQ
jgi:hypothetical protein